MATEIVFGRLVCRCEKCHWVWLAREGKEPKDVNNCTRCRSLNWNENLPEEIQKGLDKKKGG